MHNRIRRITETAVMLALLICLQWAGSFVPDQTVKQLLTGTMVNCVLAVTVLLVGCGSGIAVALLSPICAFLFGIAPNLITVFPIMLGNCCYVTLLYFITGKCRKFGIRQIAALVTASVVKFAVLYVLVVEVICGVAADALLYKKLGETVLLAPKMLTMLPAMFTWPQLITALAGGAIALANLPILRKALHR